MSREDIGLLFVAIAALLGMAGGFTYFRMLRNSVDRLVAGGSWWQLALAAVLRFGVALVLFAGLARLGAVPLLSGLGGFLLARWLHTSRSAPHSPDT
jgi:hypothetical protein